MVSNGYKYLEDKDYYVRVLHDSEIDPPDNVDIIGFDEVYNLFNYT